GLADVLHLLLLGALDGLRAVGVRTVARLLALETGIPALLQRLRLRLQELRGLLADRALTLVRRRPRAERARVRAAVVEGHRLVDRGFVDAREARGDVGAVVDVVHARTVLEVRAGGDRVPPDGGQVLVVHAGAAGLVATAALLADDGRELV